MESVMEECKYCSQYKDIAGTTPEANVPILHKIFDFIGREQEVSAQIWPDGLYLLWSNDYEDIALDDLQIRYCPMCGRKLGDE